MKIKDLVKVADSEEITDSDVSHELAIVKKSASIKLPPRTVVGNDNGIIFVDTWHNSQGDYATVVEYNTKTKEIYRTDENVSKVFATYLIQTLAHGGVEGVKIIS